jgi:predicted transcriptional regulator
MDDQGAIEQTAEIISAFVSNNAIGLADRPPGINSKRAQDSCSHRQR